MVNKFTNINKTNNHFSSQIIEIEEKNHGTLKIQALDWESHKHILILAELFKLFFHNRLFCFETLFAEPLVFAMNKDEIMLKLNLKNKQLK
jgi:hypothetical protein